MFRLQKNFKHPIPAVSFALFHFASIAFLLSALIPLLFDASITVATPTSTRAVFNQVRLLSASGDALTVKLNLEALRSMASQSKHLVIAGWPTSAKGFVDLQLEPFNVIGPGTKVVLGRLGEPDVPFAYDPQRVLLLRGTLAGHSQSSVFLALSDKLAGGRINIGPQSFALRLLETDAQSGQARLVVEPPTRGAWPDVPKCGLTGATALVRPTAVAGVTSPRPGIKKIEIALETDYELYRIFNNPTAETDYLVSMIGALSNVYLRDVNAYFTITYIRLWDNPNDLFNEPDPLFPFVNYWNANMGFVNRDIAQFASGRRDLPYGGVAFIEALCTNFAYSVIGYLIGSFPEPGIVTIGDYDVSVAAHEIGHNCGTPHTHDYSPPIDRCYPPPTIPSRGEIMSYCSQQVSGGNAVEDLRFTTRVQEVIRAGIESAFCVADDCNLNLISDAVDIAQSTSADSNGNGVPDECEDCNGNGTLDPFDIGAGSTDLNSNGIPDECEPDCNGNLQPDDRDIELGALDQNLDGVPDLCQADCNVNKTPDYSEIQGNLSRDIDRNVILDECEDCDGDGTANLIELAGAHHAWIASDFSNSVGEYHSLTGVRIKNAESGHLNNPQDVVISKTWLVLVSSANDDRVASFNPLTGAFAGDFVTAGLGGLDYPTGMTLALNGDVLVSSRNSNAVLRYEGSSGAFLGAFIPSGLGGLVGPFGLEFGPNGHLYVACSDNQVREYDSGGAFVRIFVNAGNNGGLMGPRGIAFKPDGNLLVAGYLSDTVHEYNGTTGGYVGVFPNGGTLYGPWGVRMGPNGNVFVTRDYEMTSEGASNLMGVSQIDGGDGPQPLHTSTTRLYEYDVSNGYHLRTYVIGDDTGLWSPTGFGFYPGHLTDCNVNAVPDNCDLAAGMGVDCNSNGVMDACDISAGLTSDCNANQIPDECDIAGGTSQDQDGDGVPDECVFIPDVPSAEPGGVNKNRYLSFQVPDSGGVETALEIKMVSLLRPDPPSLAQFPPPDFAEYEGQVRWVGPVSQCMEIETTGATFACATVQCTPHYANWSAEPGSSVLHVSGAEIVPSSVYEIRQFGPDCQGRESNCSRVSPALTVVTGRWGDVTAPFQEPAPVSVSQPNISDVAAIVNKFKLVPGAMIVARGDLSPHIPDQRVNIEDVGSAVDGFKQFWYPYSGPCPCPPTVSCPGVDACGRCSP